MRTTFASMCILALFDNVSAARSQKKFDLASPFVGQHADADFIVEQERVTTKLALTNSDDLRGTKVNSEFKLNQTQQVKDRSATIPKFNEYFKNQGTVFEDAKARRLHNEVKKMVAQEKASNKKLQQTSKRLGANPQVNLKNRFQNMLYSGPAYVGSLQERQSLIYDTGSDWVVIEDSSCRSCFGTNFNSTMSTSFTGHDCSDVTILEYGTAYVEGKTGSDDICLDSTQTNCVNEQNLFLVDYQDGIPPDVDGILGLGQGGPYSLTEFGEDKPEEDEQDKDNSMENDQENLKYNGDEIEEHELGDLFVNGLFNAEKISKKLFAFYLTNHTEDSYVDFGAARDTGMSNVDDLVYLSMMDHFFWLGTWQAVRFGPADADNSNDFAFNEGEVPVIYDTGSSVTLIGSDQADGFFHELTKDQEYVEIWDGVIITTCDYTVWPEVFFLTGDLYWVSILPEDYIVKSMETPDDEDICFVNMVPSWDNFWLAGNNVLRGYYSIHDMENHKLGLVPHTTSTKSRVTDGTVPNQKLNAPFPFMCLLRNIFWFCAAWAGWYAWIEYQVENVVYWGQYDNKKIQLQGQKQKKVQSQDDLKSILTKLQAQLDENQEQ